MATKLRVEQQWRARPVFMQCDAELPRASNGHGTDNGYGLPPAGYTYEHGTPTRSLRSSGTEKTAGLRRGLRLGDPVSTGTRRGERRPNGAQRSAPEVLGDLTSACAGVEDPAPWCQNSPPTPGGGGGPERVIEGDDSPAPGRSAGRKTARDAPVCRP